MTISSSSGTIQNVSEQINCGQTQNRQKQKEKKNTNRVYWPKQHEKYVWHASTRHTLKSKQTRRE